MARIKSVDANLVRPVCILIVLLLATHHGGVSNALIYDRGAVLDAEIFRLLTFHFVHVSYAHVLINIFTLTVLWLLYGGTMRMHEWMGAIVWSGCAIGLCLLLLSPEIQWAVGLSGLLYALFAFASIRAVISGDYLSWAVLALLIGKVVSEQTTGSSAAMEHFIGSSIIVDTHMYGVIAGLLFGIISSEIGELTKSLIRGIPRFAIGSGQIDGKT